MEDLVGFAKSNVEKIEKRIEDTKTDIEKSKVEKKAEEESVKNL